MSKSKQSFDPTKPILRVIPVPMDADWQPPVGYDIREMVCENVGTDAQFYAVCTKKAAKAEEVEATKKSKSQLRREAAMEGAEEAPLDQPEK